MLYTKPKILTVDDRQNNRFALHKLLQRLNCEVVQASSGNEALALCVDTDFALILMDVDMPDMDGYEVAQLLKGEASTQHIPIIFLTASFEAMENQLKGYESGAVDYIFRPVNDFIMLSKVGVFLDLYNSRQQAARELQRSESMRIATSLSEARFRQALMDAPIAIMLHAEGGEVMLLSRVWTAISGYKRKDIPTVAAWVVKAIDADCRDSLQHYISQLCTNTEWSTDGEYRIKKLDGNFCIWDFRSGPLPPLPDGRRLVITMAVDVTELRAKDEAKRLALAVFNTVADAVVVTDTSNRIVAVNPSFTSITGYCEADVLGCDPKILSSGKHPPEFYKNLWERLQKSGSWQGEIWNKTSQGELYLGWLALKQVLNEQGNVANYIGVFSDITEKKKSEELIWHHANFDSLTQLPNRRMFHDRLAQEIRKSNRDSQNMALMFIDLDRFKEVNDTLGHKKGDLLLIEASRRIIGCVRETDAVARLGGDEFTVLMTNLDDAESVQRVAEDIVRQLSASIDLEGDVVYVSASIGIAMYPGDASGLDELLKCADQAMYVAKDAGRNRHAFYSPDLQETAQKRARLLNDLRSALIHNEFCLYYQPIVNLSSGRIEKVEALIRWQHPRLGLINPMEFIPLAEESGLIVEIGDWVFHEAARQAEHWHHLRNETLVISINVSPAQFRYSNSVFNAWIDHLRDINLPGIFINVEITEGLILDASPTVTNGLLKFRDAGILVSLDDFGTGYSALSYLRKFNINFLKIDQSFVRNLSCSSSDMTLCEAIIVMAHKLGIKVIAEGVETTQQRDLLQAAGCDFAQGFLISHPVPAQELEKILLS